MTRNSSGEGKRREKEAEKRERTVEIKGGWEVTPRTEALSSSNTTAGDAFPKASF